jgi:hypothetical protein
MLQLLQLQLLRMQIARNVAKVENVAAATARNLQQTPYMQVSDLSICAARH